MSGLRIVIIGRGARDTSDFGWGLGQDARVVEMAIRAANASGTRIASIDHLDATSFYGSGRRPRAADINIHLEVPCRAAWPWAHVNMVMVNQEWWYNGKWDWACAPVSEGGADYFLFKSNYARSLFPEIDGRRSRVIPWRCTPEINAGLSDLGAAGGRREFLYLIGASANKSAAAHAIVGAWRSVWPPLRVVGVEAVLRDLRAAHPSAAASGVIFHPPFDTDSERIAAQVSAVWHVVGSAAEGFGFTFAEAAAVGALPLWTDIPVYNELYGELLGSAGRIARSSEGGGGEFRDPLLKIWRSEDVANAVEGLLSLPAEDAARLRGALKHLYTSRIKEHRHAWKALIGATSTRLRGAAPLVLPPRPPPAPELPRVTVVTLTRNRPRWWLNMARNILLADYPADKLTWVVADDSDAGGRVDEQIMRFQEANPHIHVKYLSLPRPLAIGTKRNRACEAAPETDIYVMMDDDDHYPKSSIIARVTWLRAFGAGAVYCATLPMYDCKNYISAINVPPLNLSAAERVSEASLAFTRAFWLAGKFPAAVSVAEGEGFLEGRAKDTAEIPPEGVIVSFLHGANATSRRVPDSTEPNGCHYGFDDEYFTFLSERGLDGSKS